MAEVKLVFSHSKEFGEEFWGGCFIDPNTKSMLAVVSTDATTGKTSVVKPQLKGTKRELENYGSMRAAALFLKVYLKSLGYDSVRVIR